jgi:hypothetical protein
MDKEKPPGEYQCKVSHLMEQKCQSLSLYETENQKGSICSTSTSTRLFLLFTFLPSLPSIYAFVLLWFSCINYDTNTNSSVALFWSLFGCWGLGFLLLFGKSAFFIPYAQFCSPTHRDNHKIIHWAIFLTYACILFGYEVYAYSLNEWAAIVTVLFWGLYILFYIMLFVEGHVRPCPGVVSGEAKKHSLAFKKFIFILTGIVHIGLLFVCIIFNNDLTAAWRTAKVVSGECL